MAFYSETKGVIVGTVHGRHQTFDDYLEQKCDEQGGFDGVLDDDMDDAFERWLEGVDPAMLIQWGNEAVELTASRV